MIPKGIGVGPSLSLAGKRSSSSSVILRTLPSRAPDSSIGVRTCRGATILPSEASSARILIRFSGVTSNGVLAGSELLSWMVGSGARRTCSDPRLIPVKDGIADEDEL